jgi:hypothetical protein
VTTLLLTAPDAAPLDVDRYDLFIDGNRCFIGIVLDDLVELMNIEPETIVFWLEECGRCDSIDAAGRDVTAVCSGDDPNNYEAPNA